jgi:hypothetical protein
VKNFYKRILLIAAVFGAMLAGISLMSRSELNLSANSKGQSTAVSPSGNQTTPSQPAQNLEREKILEAYGKLPLVFEPNYGQTDERVKFVSRGQGYGLFLTDTEAVLSLRKVENRKASTAVVRMKLAGANTGAKSFGVDESEAKSNYFLGNDSQKWQAGVPNFHKVRYEQIYSGVDLIYYGNGRELEYDFEVEPGADPNQIKLNFEGVSDARLDEKTGDLLLKTALGTIRQHRPIVYQETGGERKEIASGYAISKDEKNFAVKFAIGSYDTSKALTIDPILVYSSYLGGGQTDVGNSIAVDNQGNAYITGNTSSLNFPTTQGTIKPVLDNPNVYWTDAFVTKVNPSGTALVFSTYFGGRNGSEFGNGIAVDASGNVLVSGLTGAADFPTLNAYQPTFGGGPEDAFAAKLNPTGSQLIYSTFIGGNNTDIGGKIALNPATGEAVFAGTSYSPNFPTTAGAYKPKLCDTQQSCNGIFFSGGYVARLTASGAAQYVTLFTSAINDVALDASDNAVIVGSTNALNFPVTAGAFQTASSGGIEGFIAKLNPSGSAVIYGSYLGGGFQSDRINGVALDAAGNMYVTGQTENLGFPTTEGAFDRTYNGGEDAFVTKFNAAGSALTYSTFLGGTGRDKGFAIAVGENDNAFIAGETANGATFPLRNSINGTHGTIFLTRFNTDASALVFSSIFGIGGAYDLALDSASNAYLTGQARNIVVTPGVFQPVKGEETTVSTHDGFVMKVGAADENATSYSISGTVTDPTQFGNYSPVIVTLSGAVNRSYMLPYGSGNGVLPYYFGALPAGGNYTVTARKIGFATEPESVTFNNLQANQFADFTIQSNEEPQGVITSPQHGATYNAPASITIQATALDPDGHAIQKVDFEAYSSELGTISLGTDTTAPYEITWPNAPMGTWALYAIPTDELGLRGYSTPVVHVEVLDTTSPAVVLTSPQDGSSFTAGTNISLSANVSSSIAILEFYAGDVRIGRRTSAPWTMTWRPLETGTYNIYAKGITSTNQTVTTPTVAVSVTAFNHRIAGKIRNSLTGNGLSDVTVNLTSSTNPSISASTTTDADGNYLLTNLNATPNDGVTITPTLNGYNFTPQNINIVYLGYVDREYEHFSAVPQTGISVNLISPNEGETFTAPATINLAATASSTASGITKVDFYSVESGTPALIGTDTTPPYELPWTDVPANFYFLYARATDGTGAVADSPTVWVRVNAAPTGVSINGQVRDPAGFGMPGITLQLTGTQTQTVQTNTLGYYGFYNLPIGGSYTVTPQPSAITFTPTAQTFTNLTTDLLDVDFTSSAANQAPTVQFNSPTDGATFNMPAVIPISATASDADGSIVHLSVSASNGSFSSTIGQTNGSTYNAPWQPAAPGNYTLTAQARDNGGRQSFVQLNITVNAPGPVSVSGRIVNRDSQSVEGATVTLRDYPEEQNVIATATTDANGNYTIPNVATFNSYILRAEKLNYSFSPQQRIYFNLAANQTADFTGTLALQPGDFDGDGETDVAYWRPAEGLWSIKRSSDETETSIQFGSADFGDIPVPGNYDGDQKTDIAVYRSGNWYILNSSNNQVRGMQFGLPDDKAVAGDYDGDGKTDIAVWRASTGSWYVSRSSDNQFWAMQWGTDGDAPLASDYDGDGITDLTVWRPSTGAWYIRQSSDGQMRTAQFGMAGDIPLVADVDGDKKADLTVFRPSTGVWYVLKSSDNSFAATHWGATRDIPIPGDYDHDGKTDLAVFRPIKGRWFVLKSSDGNWTVQDYGLNGDVPIPASYNR